jgi:hypothetical protein
MNYDPNRQDSGQGQPGQAGAAVSQNQQPPPAAQAQPEPNAPEITELVYMPGPGDSDTTTVDGLEFKAYEPIKLTDRTKYLGSKLHANPFFSSTHDMKKDHDDRKKAWEANREAHKKLADAHAEVDKLEKAAI